MNNIREHKAKKCITARWTSFRVTTIWLCWTLFQLCSVMSSFNLLFFTKKPRLFNIVRQSDGFLVCLTRSERRLVYPNSVCVGLILTYNQQNTQLHLLTSEVWFLYDAYTHQIQWFHTELCTKSESVHSSISCKGNREISHQDLWSVVAQQILHVWFVWQLLPRCQEYRFLPLSVISSDQEEL